MIKTELIQKAKAGALTTKAMALWMVRSSKDKAMANAYAKHLKN